MPLSLAKTLAEPADLGTTLSEKSSSQGEAPSSHSREALVPLEGDKRFSELGRRTGLAEVGNVPQLLCLCFSV